MSNFRYYELPVDAYIKLMPRKSVNDVYIEFTVKGTDEYIGQIRLDLEDYENVDFCSFRGLVEIAEEYEAKEVDKCDEPTNVN